MIKMSEIDKVLAICLNEVGYAEKQSNANLDSKNLNAGNKNYTKYARDLDNIPNFYNSKKQGYAWCCVFVDWCFVKALGVERARNLLCYLKNSAGAGCDESIKYYKSKNRFVTNNPIKGDQIFFRQGHTGLVYKVDKTKVYTIEGNTNKSLGVVSNGGEVCKKSYNLKNNSIIGYGRPIYNISNEIKVAEKFGYKFGREISKELRIGLTSKNLNAKAHIKIGCILTILEIKEDSNGLIWGHNYDGWLVLCEKDGTKQLVFVRNK